MIDALTAQFLRYSSPLEPEQETLRRLTSAVTPRTIKKGEHLARAGETSEALYFVGQGLLRYYYLNDGVEHTGQFFGENTFVADVHALVTGAPTLQYIDALEETVVLLIAKTALLAAYDADHAMERFGRRVMEEAMAGSQRRSASLLTRSPEQRYADLVKNRPNIVRRVPQYIVASYLGITPESLSRIRSRRVSGD